jgi:hypothetical protein
MKKNKGKPIATPHKFLAGAPGFEPGNGGIKIRCLTTWLRPNCAVGLPSAARPVGGRTLAASFLPINL